jgi:hypothetical protein
MAADAAEAADDEPRASMIAAPRFWTVGMKSSSIQAWSSTTSAAVRVLRGRVVAPDRHAPDRGHRLLGLVGELRYCPVVVEPGHGGEPLARDVRRVVHRDQRVGVGRVADDEDPQVVGCLVGQRFSLHGEDGAVGLEQVAPLHALGPRPGADQHRDVDAVEGCVGVVADRDPVQQGERAVVELHRHALGRTDRGRDLQQAELDRGVRPEHGSARDPVEQAVTDLAGSAGDGNFHGRGHARDASKRRGDPTRRV